MAACVVASLEEEHWQLEDAGESCLEQMQGAAVLGGLLASLQEQVTVSLTVTASCC